jgi:hypothetical protein
MDKEASKELVWLVYVCLVLAEMHVYLWCDQIYEWKTYTIHFEIEKCSNLKTIVYDFIYSIQIIIDTDDMIFLYY